MASPNLESARSSFGCLDGGLELVGGKSWHALDATHSLRSIPHRQAQKRFGIARIDDINEIVISLSVVDRLHLPSKIYLMDTSLMSPAKCAFLYPPAAARTRLCR